MHDLLTRSFLKKAVENQTLKLTMMMGLWMAVFFVVVLLLILV